MNGFTRAADARGAALERDLRDWLRTFDPGPASPSLRLRVAVAAGRPSSAPAARWGGLGRLGGVAGFAAAAGLLVLTAAILAAFGGSRASVGAPWTEPSIVPSEVPGAPSATWWLPAALAGAIAYVVAFVAWPWLRRVARALVPVAVPVSSVREPAARRFDRVVQVAIVLFVAATAAACVYRLAEPTGWSAVLDWNFAPWVVLLVLPVPIVLHDAAAWRRQPWLVAGAILYPASTALRIVLPWAADPTPLDGSSIITVAPPVVAELAAAVAPLVLAVGIARWLGLRRGVPRWLAAAALGACLTLAVLQLLTASYAAPRWYFINALLVASEIALTAVGIATLIEPVRSWSARWIAVSGISLFVAIAVAYAEQMMIYAAGAASNPFSVDGANRLLQLQIAAYTIYAVALFLAFARPRRPRISWNALRTAGLTPPDGAGDASEEPLPGEDR